MMKSNVLFTKRRPRGWSARMTQAARRGRLFTLLAALVLALVFGLSAAPAAYAFPAEEPPACTVVGWGDNSAGQATPPAGLSDATAIAAGGGYNLPSHSLALNSDGTVIGWGADYAGQATPPAGLSDVTAIAAGGSHSLALKADGTVVAWGWNNEGQSTPPAGLSDVVAIAAGATHSLALKSDGTVVGWGDNSSGQSTPPAGLSDVTAIAAGDGFGLALKEDGTVVGWGINWYGQATPPAGLSDVVAISTGNSHSLALKEDGTVVGWGYDYAGDTTPPAGLSDVKAIAAGGFHSLALKEDGTVVGWGDNSFGQATPPVGLSGVTAIAGGYIHSLVLQCTGPSNNPPTVTANNASVTVQQGQMATNSGTVSDPDGDTVTLSASVGTVVDNGDGTWSWSYTPGSPGGQTVTITADDGNGGTSETSFRLYVTAPTACAVVGWGWNNNGQATPPAGLSDVVALAGGGFHSLALKADGTVVAWGSNNAGQATPPAGLNNVVAIAAGASHSLALKADGTVVGWGNNGSGQATPPVGLNDVIAIAAGTNHSLALKADGTVVGWGSNSAGQATPPVGLSDVTAIAAGSTHSLALKADDTAVGWGNNGSGQATPPAGLSNVTAIAAGFQHSLALKADGTVVGWGNNGSGQASPPAGLSNVTAIAAATAGSHNLALKSDGTVVGWGDNSFGQLNIPAGLSNVTAIAAGQGHSLAAISQCAPANQPPVVAANSTSVTVDEGQTATNTGTVSDPDGDAVSLSASVGTVVNNGDGTWSWSFVTSDGPAQSQTVTINADDGNGGVSETSFDLTVNNVAPTVDAGPDQTVFRNDVVTVSGSWSDPAGAADTPYAWSWDLSGDTLVDDSGSANYGDTIVHTTSFAVDGVATLTFSVTDKEGATASDTVNITVVNRAPVANDQSVSTNEDTPLPITLTASDADNDTLVYTLIDLPDYGILSGTAPNLTYTPDPDYFAPSGLPDSFTFKVNDGLADSNIATVSINVNSVNDPVVAVDDTATTLKNVPVTIPVQANDSAGPANEDQTLTTTAVTTPANGTAVINPDGSVTYTPNFNFFGLDSFAYTVCDSEGACATATVTVLVEWTNDPPTAVDDSATTNEDTPVTFDVLANDSDVDGNLNPASVTVVSAPSNGALVLNGNGSFTYTPAAGFSGVDSFVYEVCDTDGVCASATVSITVLYVNKAPVCTGAAPSVSVLWPPNHQFKPVTVNGVTDIEGNPITIAVTSIFQDEPTNGTGDGDTSPDGQGIGSSTAEVRAERKGNGNGRYYHISFSASDGQGGSCTGTVKVSVPKNQGNNGAAVDDGPLNDSTQP